MASNADVWKDVFPLDVIPYYKIGKSRLGLGLTFHLAPQIDWDWLAPTEEFDDAQGVLFEYSYGIFSIGYTDISYTSVFREVDASHVFFKLNNAF